MACGCGGNGSGGGCGDSPPVAAAAAKAPVVQQMEPGAGALAETAAGELSQELIASSEQQWPRIKVNGIAIAPEAIAQELQYHPAKAREEAVFLASQALVIRELLLQRATELGLQVTAASGVSEEEALSSALIEREVPLPRADDDSCQRYYQSNRARFASAPLLGVRHILLGCAAHDGVERSNSRERAEALIGQLQGNSEAFAELAQAHSDCPSKAQGGELGQISQGQTVPEFERQLFRLPLGLASKPLESRYGFHVVQVDLRVEGQPLPYEAVAGAIAAELDQRVWQVAVAQYLQQLVGEADIQGIVLSGADSPLVQ